MLASLPFKLTRETLKEREFMTEQEAICYRQVELIPNIICEAHMWAQLSLKSVSGNVAKSMNTYG